MLSKRAVPKVCGRNVRIFWGEDKQPMFLKDLAEVLETTPRALYEKWIKRDRPVWIKNEYFFSKEYCVKLNARKKAWAELMLRKRPEKKVKPVKERKSTKLKGNAEWLALSDNERCEA